MAKLLLPDSRGRSATAVPGKSDLRDEHVFSALVYAHGGSGQQTAFSVPRGQSIPQIKGSSITPAQAHHLTYTELSTNISQAGQLGSAIGDASIRGLGVTIEQAPYTTAGASAGAIDAYGAGQREVAEILNKTFFQLKIAGKKQIEGPTFLFPAVGGIMGALASTGNAAVVAGLSNGWPGLCKKLKIPILVGRTDTVEGLSGVGGSATLSFTTTASAGQETLVWYVLQTLVKGDVR